MADLKNLRAMSTPGARVYMDEVNSKACVDGSLGKNEWEAQCRLSGRLKFWHGTAPLCLPRRSLARFDARAQLRDGGQGRRCVRGRVPLRGMRMRQQEKILFNNARMLPRWWSSRKRAHRRPAISAYRSDIAGSLSYRIPIQSKAVHEKRTL